MKNYIEESIKRKSILEVTTKNATAKTISKLNSITNKEQYNLFDKLILKYKLGINNDNIREELLAIASLLEEMYINNEISSKEKSIIMSKLEEKEKEVKKIYSDYVDISHIVLKNYLKTNISVPNMNISSYSQMIKQVPNIFPLILTTADGFLYNFKDYIDNKKQIDAVIIDESSQCDVITGIPLLFMAKKIIVVGDSKQLSAITNNYVPSSIDEKYRNDDNNFLKLLKMYLIHQQQCC